MRTATKRLNLLFCLSLLFLFQSCENSCPGLQDKDLCWIPYNVNDNLKYSDGENVISFKINEFYKTPPTSFGGIAMDYECNFEGYYKSDVISQGYFIYEHIGYGRYQFENRRDGIRIQLTDQDVFIFDILYYPNPFESDSINITFHNDTLINQKHYYDVFKVSKVKQEESQRIEWIVKAKDKGIIQFYDRKLNTVWTLTEEE